MFYAFGEYVLDPQRYMLYRSGRPIQLRPKVFQVLDYFITHRDRVISKSELAAHVWPDTFISDAVLENTIRAVRKALGDSASAQRYIETRRGHGYRFVADITSRETLDATPPAPSPLLAEPAAAQEFVPEPMLLPARHQLPPIPRDFTGRISELTELTNAFKEGKTTISGLSGMGGIGKTTLALKLAEQLLPDYPDAQFYLDLKGMSAQPLSPSDAMAYVIRSLYPQTTLPEREAELSGLYQSVLYHQRAILLMDNAADAEQVTPLIPPPSCILLVTSRYHFTLPGLHAKRLDALPLEDACALLRTIVPRIGSHAEALADLCGALPLALRLTASTLAEREELDPTAYIQRLLATPERLQLTGVPASLRLSVDLLPVELQQYWYMLAVFPDTFDSQATAAVWALDQHAAEQKLSTLRAYSLVEWRPENSRYRLHDLVRLFAEEQLDNREPERSEAQPPELGQTQRVIYERLVAYYNDFISDHGGRRHTLTADKVSALDVEWRNAIAAVDAAGRLSAWQAMYQITRDLGNFLTQRGWWSVHEQLYQRTLKAMRHADMKQMEGFLLTDMGRAYAHQGRLAEAEQLCLQGLGSHQETGNRWEEGITRCYLGFLYLQQSHLDKAEQSYQQGLTICREVGNQIDEGMGIVALGRIYTLGGRWTEAETLFQQGLTMHQEIGNQVGAAIALNHLSSLYLSQEHWTKAEPLLQQSLAITHAIGYRPLEGHVLANLGAVYLHNNCPEKAISILQQSLTIHRELGTHTEGGRSVYLAWPEPCRNSGTRLRRCASKASRSKVTLATPTVRESPAVISAMFIASNADGQKPNRSTNRALPYSKRIAVRLRSAPFCSTWVTSMWLSTSGQKLSRTTNRHSSCSVRWGIG